MVVVCVSFIVLCVLLLCVVSVVLPRGIVVVVFSLVDFFWGKAFVKTAACLACTRI